MSKIDVPPEHDQEARARIRNKLLHYMREHRIGAPELTARIYAAQEPQQKKSVGISTVQRFLANKVRTVESYVGMFERFVEKFPSPDPIGVLGNAMAEYYGSEGSDLYRGKYKSTISYETARSRVLLFADLTITPDDGFCRVVERSDMATLVICDGVLVCNGQTAIMSLRDRTTKAPKQYLICGGKEKYSGRGTMAEFEPNVAGPINHPSLHFVSASIERRSVAYLTKPLDRISTLEAMYRAIFQPAAKDLIVKGSSEPIIRQSLRATLLAKFKRLSDGKLMPEEKQRKKTKRMSPDKIQAEFLVAAERGDETALRKLFENGADINIADSETGLTALHLAVGRNSMKAARFLVEHGALFTPDKFGRLPTTIAAESEVSEKLCDFIVEAEAAAEARAKGV